MLSQYNIGDKIILSATIGQFSIGVIGKVCLIDLKDDKGRVSHHQWVSYDYRFLNLRLKRNDHITFEAVVYEYEGLNKKGKQVTKRGINNLRYINKIQRGHNES